MEHIKDIETREEMYLKIPKGGIGAEIGVCKGMNAINLFFLCRPTTMFLIDVWCELNEPHGSDPKLWFTDHSVLISKIFEKEIEQGTVVTHKGFAVDWLCALPDNTLDWIYLDAYHEYDPISTELALAIDKVKRGGYIMGHDYRLSLIHI